MTLNERIIQALELTTDELNEINAIEINEKTGRPYGCVADVSGSTRVFHFQRMVNGRPQKLYSTHSEQDVVLVAKSLNWLLPKGEIDPTDPYTQHWTYKMRNVINNDTFKNIMRQGAKQINALSE